jgi:PIN domain
VTLVTPALFVEYEAMSKRPEQQLVLGLHFAAIDQFLAAFADASEAVEIAFQWRPQLKDANGEMVLETALNGQADVLITHNVKDFIGAAERLAKEDGVSFNQWISVAIAQKIGAVETAADFLKRRAGRVRASDMMPFLENARNERVATGDEV